MVRNRGSHVHRQPNLACYSGFDLLMLPEDQPDTGPREREKFQLTSEPGELVHCPVHHFYVFTSFWLWAVPGDKEQCVGMGHIVALLTGSPSHHRSYSVSYGPCGQQMQDRLPERTRLDTDGDSASRLPSSVRDPIEWQPRD